MLDDNNKEASTNRRLQSDQALNPIATRSRTLRPASPFILLLLMLPALPMLSSGMRLQACDEDFRQVSNWLCTRPGEKTPCYKYYFNADEWKDNYTQTTLAEIGQRCCKETGCAVADLKLHCCLDEKCIRFCYDS